METETDRANIQFTLDEFPQQVRIIHHDDERLSLRKI